MEQRRCTSQVIKDSIYVQCGSYLHAQFCRTCHENIHQAVLPGCHMPPCNWTTAVHEWFIYKFDIAVFPGVQLLCIIVCFG